MKSLLHIFFCLLICSTRLWAQQRIVGKIYHGKDVLPTANIFIKNSYDGCSSNAQGEYALTTDLIDTQTLVITCIGFQKLEKKIVLQKNKTIQANFNLKEQVNELNTVTIVAGSFDAGGDIKKTTILSSLDIATTAGAEADIFSAIQTLPGTQPASQDEGLFVRGGTANETKTLYDGTWVQKPFMNDMPSVSQRGRFSAFSFKGMSFSSGAYSAQYGQALSSVLVLDSKDITEKTTSDIGIMSVGASLGHTQRFKRSSVNVNASYFNLKLANSIIHQNIDWIKDPSSVQFGTTVRKQIGKQGLLKVYAEYTENKASYRYDNPENNWEKSSLYNHDKSVYSNISYQDYFSKNWKSNTGISINVQNADVEIDTNQINKQDQLVHARTMLTGTINNLSQIRFGVENISQFKFEKYNALDRSLDENITAMFVEADYFLTNRLVLRMGLRGEKSFYLNQQSLVPRASISYKYKKYTQVGLSYGIFTQNPNDAYLIQQSNLQFEKASHYLLNYQWIKDQYIARIELYHKEYSSLITEQPNNALSNNGYGYARGLDIFWRDKKNIKRGDYWISYSFVDTKRKFMDYPSLAQPTFVSKHVINIVYKEYIPKITTQIGITYTYASGRSYSVPNETTYLSGKAKDIHNLSANASYITTVANHFSVLYISVGNVAGIKNVFGYNTSSDGALRAIEPNARRTVFVGLFISIGDDNVLN